MNLVVTSYNPDESITNKNIQGRFIPPKTDNKATQPQQSSSEEGSKENTILNGPAIDREKSAQGHPSRSTGNKPQGSAPAAPTTQAGGPSQAPPVTKPSTSHQDPPEHNDTNGSTKAPTNGKGPGATKSKKASTNTSPATQPSESTKNTIICSQCGKSGHWSKNCPHHNFCDFCRVTTHSTHMCRATKRRPRSPVCIYCGKSNHSSANCRYRPKDNREEPRQTPDALKTGATSENLTSASRNQTGPAPHTTNNNPFSHIDGRGQNHHYGGPQRSHHREQNGTAPRGEQTDNNNQNFPPRRQQHAYFDEGYNRRYSPPMFPSPTFNNTMASDAVGRSIIQLAENQSRSLDFILVGQQSQMDAYREMTQSNQAREDDALFAGINVYDGEDPSKFEGWLDAMEQACNMTDRNLRKELMKKSSGAIRETISMMSTAWTNDDIISKLRQDFSSMSTMNRAREELKDLKQLPGQPISSYMYKYGRIHFLTTGNQAHNERYLTAIMEFIESLNPKLMRALAKKHADPRTRPQMLQQAFNMAEEASRRILETESFERSSTVRFTGSVNNIYQCESEINEVSRGRYNNSNYKGGYNKGNNYKGKNDYYGKKDWNKNTKGSYQKKEDKKESKDKDVYLTLTKDVKFRCPAGFNENIFACACKMIQEKVNSARQAGVTDIKTINAVEKDNFMRVFNFPEDVYDSAWAQATGEEDPGSSGDTSN